MRTGYRNILIVGIIAMLATVLPMTFAQQEYDCPTVAAEAFETAHSVCTGLDRHQVCYGHVKVDATSQPGFNIVQFNQPGDTTDIAYLQSLNLAPYNSETGVWGVAQLRLQAEVPTSKTEDVTVLVFGNVGIDNGVLAPTEAQVTLVDKPLLRVYTQPSYNSTTSFWLDRGATVTARERLVDSSWLRIEDSDNRIGWIPTPMIKAEGNLRTLNVVDPLAPYLRPMQAFYFQSANDADSCTGLPPSGLLVQTPEGQAEVSLLINEVSISMNATAFLQATPSDNMTFSLLSGTATVSTPQGEQTLIPGTQVSIPMSAAGTASGAPSAPGPYSSDLVSLLPTDMLPTQIVASAPVTPVTVSAPTTTTTTATGTTPVTTTSGTTTTTTTGTTPVTTTGGTTTTTTTGTTPVTTTGGTTTTTTTTGTTPVTTTGGTTTTTTTTGTTPVTTTGTTTTTTTNIGNCGNGQGTGNANCTTGNNSTTTSSGGGNSSNAPGHNK